jgi:hypothetical protein
VVLVVGALSQVFLTQTDPIKTQSPSIANVHVPLVVYPEQAAALV